MRRALIGAILGLILGAAAAVLLAFLVQLNQPVPEDNTMIWLDLGAQSRGYTLPPVGQARETAPFADQLYYAVLVGGGFGSIVGAVVGAAGAIVRALKDVPA
jgi:hypothetical protein